MFWTIEFWKIRFMTGGIYDGKCTMFNAHLCTGQRALDVHLYNFLPYSFAAGFLLKCGHPVVSLCPISLRPGLPLNLRLVCFARLTVSPSNLPVLDPRVRGLLVDARLCQTCFVGSGIQAESSRLCSKCF